MLVSKPGWLAAGFGSGVGTSVIGDSVQPPIETATRIASTRPLHTHCLRTGRFLLSFMRSRFILLALGQLLLVSNTAVAQKDSLSPAAGERTSARAWIAPVGIAASVVL